MSIDFPDFSPAENASFCMRLNNVRKYFQPMHTQGVGTYVYARDVFDTHRHTPSCLSRGM